MRKLIILFLLVAVSSCSLFTLYRSNAWAQGSPKTFTLTVDQGDLAVMGEALGALPFNKVAPLINKLQSQVSKQQAPAAPVDANGNKAK